MNHDRIMRIACHRIAAIIQNHVSDLEFRIDFMSFDHRQSTAYQLIMRCLKHHIGPVFIIPVNDACLMPWRFCNEQRIDLIECQPVSDFIAIASEYGLCVCYSQIDQLPASPSAVFLHQLQRQFKVMQRDHRFDAVFQQFIENTVIEGKTCFVWFCIIPIGIDP